MTRTSSWKRHILDGAGFPYLMALPAMVILGVIIGLPVVNAVLLSFQDVILTRPNRPATWDLSNYARMLGDWEVWASIGRSALYMLGTVGGAMLIGGAAALLTRRAFRGIALVRLIFILPWSIPAVAAALIWGVMYDPNFGVLNRIIALFAPNFGGLEWLLDRNTALSSLVLIQVWNEFPIAYLFLLAGLQTIDDDLYKAARIDGASAFQQFRYITIPQMRYVGSVTAMLLAIFAFKSFAIIFILTGGGPADRTETLIIMTYNQAFRAYNFSYAAALSVLSLLISAAMVAVYARLTLAQRAEQQSDDEQ